MKILLFFLLFFSTVTILSGQEKKIRINWEGHKLPESKKNTTDTLSNTYSLTDEIKDIYTTAYNFINNWLGTRYKFGGDSENGIDCSAFVRRLYRAVYNFELPRTCVYQYKLTERIAKECLEFGDLVFFKVKNTSKWHVGFFIGDDKFVHASGNGGSVIISNLNDSLYKRIYLSGGRVKKYG